MKEESDERLERTRVWMMKGRYIQTKDLIVCIFKITKGF